MRYNRWPVLYWPLMPVHAFIGEGATSGVATATFGVAEKFFCVPQLPEGRNQPALLIPVQGHLGPQDGLQGHRPGQPPFVE